MLVRRVQGVLIGDCLRVSEPITHDVCRISVGQFRLPSGPQVLKQLGPRLHSSPLDDLREAAPKVLGGRFCDRDDNDVFRVEGVSQVGFQLRKDRDDSRRLPLVVFGLRGVYGQQLLLTPRNSLPLIELAWQEF